MPFSPNAITSNSLKVAAIKLGEKKPIGPGNTRNKSF